MRRVALVMLTLTACTAGATRPVPTTVATVTTTTALVTTTAPATTTTTTTTALVLTTTTRPAPPPTTALVTAPAALDPPAGATARASWYAEGAWTASGLPFDPDGLTFAHLTMPFGTRVRFSTPLGSVIATCTDRGPAAWTGRQFDLSRGAFSSIAALSQGVVSLTWEYA